MSLYHRFKDRFGTAGVVLGVIAIVLAIGGSAIAGSGGLNPKQKKEVKAIAKSFAGKPGAPGAAGPTGPAGIAGPKGDNGTNGTNGANGTAGESVEVNAYEGEKCEEAEGEEGAEFTNGTGTAYACNGKEGKAGSPWTAGGTLPPSTVEGCPCTETGTWSTGARLASETEVEAAISFPIPLAAELSASSPSDPTAPEQVHYVYVSEGKNTERIVNWSGSAIEEVESTQCLGSVTEPTAEPGNLCIYQGQRSGIETSAAFPGPPFSNYDIRRVSGVGSGGALKVGAFLVLKSNAGGAYALGTWAVTAP
jgi:hypothetical protein